MGENSVLPFLIYFYFLILPFLLLSMKAVPGACVGEFAPSSVLRNSLSWINGGEGLRVGGVTTKQQKNTS